MRPQVTPAHTYRATVIPPATEADDVEPQAARGMLPTLRVKAPSAERAGARVFRKIGRAGWRVLSVDRVVAS